MLIKLVEKFRDALMLEIDEAEYVDSELSSFPHGSCEVTSQMLALYLQSQAIDNVVYTRNEIKLIEVDLIHYWVVVNNSVIVDLTAHQFEDCNDSLIVSTDSSFHRLFELLGTFEPNESDLERPCSLHGHVPFYEKLMYRLENA